MARVLIVGCGCRGRALARELIAAGHAVRGTTRDPKGLPEIEVAGAEAVVADPDRLGTLTTQLHGVTVVAWLLGSAPAAELHGPRLRTMLERLVDTPVRGFVYEAAGPAAPGGAAAVRAASARWSIQVEIVDADPADHAAWLTAMTAAVARLL